MIDPARTFATPRVAAGAVFLDEMGRILLVHPTYKNTWDVPGGYVEQGESPAAACRRELIEELRIDREPRRLLSVDWAPSDREGDKLLFLFDCGNLRSDVDEVRLDYRELDLWEWVALVDLEQYVIPRLARRIRATVDGGTYLEQGAPRPWTEVVVEQES